MTTTKEFGAVDLMPVSSNSVEGASSSYLGAARCIGMDFSAPTGPFSSIGEPSTSMMRPRVF